MKTLLFHCGTREAANSLALLLLRVGAGAMMMLGHGISKIENFSVLKDKWHVVQLWPFSLMDNPVSLVATIVAEVLASALLMLGLMTRPAALLIAFTMAVAAFEVHAKAPWIAKDGPSKEMALLYLLPAVTVLVAGAGKYSLDALIYKGRKRPGYV